MEQTPPASAHTLSDALNRLEFFTFDDPDVNPEESFVRLADVRALLDPTDVGVRGTIPAAVVRSIIETARDFASDDAVATFQVSELRLRADFGLTVIPD